MLLVGRGDCRSCWDRDGLDLVGLVDRLDADIDRGDLGVDLRVPGTLKLELGLDIFRHFPLFFYSPSSFSRARDSTVNADVGWNAIP